MVRNVTAHLFSSVNGVVESPDQFQFDAFGEAEGCCARVAADRIVAGERR